MDLRKVKTLIELLEASALAEIEISDGDSTIRLSRASSVPTAMPPAQVNPQGNPLASPLPENMASAAQASAAQPPGSQAAASATDKQVVSPMVGTFYAAASPDDPPFLSVGDSINVGDVVCIVEAMKTFNRIQAEIAGTVAAVHKQNGEPVEYGDPLFTLE